MPQRLIAGQLGAVWGTGASDIWAGGANGALLHFDGYSWSRAAQPLRDRITAIGGRAGTAWAIGDSGLVLRYE